MRLALSKKWSDDFHRSGDSRDTMRLNLSCTRQRGSPVPSGLQDSMANVWNTGVRQAKNHEELTVRPESLSRSRRGDFQRKHSKAGSDSAVSRRGLGSALRRATEPWAGVPLTHWDLPFCSFLFIVLSCLLVRKEEPVKWKRAGDDACSTFGGRAEDWPSSPAFDVAHRVVTMSVRAASYPMERRHDSCHSLLATRYSPPGR